MPVPRILWERHHDSDTNVSTDLLWACYQVDLGRITHLSGALIDARGVEGKTATREATTSLWSVSFLHDKEINKIPQVTLSEACGMPQYGRQLSRNP